MEDILSSVTGCGAHFNEVAGEYREAIMQNLPEIIGITAGFIAAEALSAFLAATPTGVGQLGAAVIQLGLAAFGAKGFVDAGGQALGHASDWLTTAWTANGDPKKIAAASKSFLKMLVSIAMAALALLGARDNIGKGLKLAAGVKITPPRIAMITAMTPGGAAVGVPVFQPGSITAAPVALGSPAATMMTGAGVAGSTVKPKQDTAATAKQEAKDKAIIKKIESEFGVESAHGLRRHGSGTTLEQQQYRAKTGYTPDGLKKSPSDATRFLSNQSLLEAYQRAMTMWKKGKPFIDVDFGTVIAEGYYKSGVKYGTTEVVRVFFNQDGKIVSGFGKLP